MWVKGNDSKVSLTKYVLTYYFEKIIMHANQRLIKLTNNRYVKKVNRGFRCKKKGRSYHGFRSNQEKTIKSLWRKSFEAT